MVLQYKQQVRAQVEWKEGGQVEARPRWGPDLVAVLAGSLAILVAVSPILTGTPPNRRKRDSKIAPKNRGQNPKIATPYELTQF